MKTLNTVYLITLKTCNITHTLILPWRVGENSHCMVCLYFYKKTTENLKFKIFSVEFITIFNSIYMYNEHVIDKYVYHCK